MYWPFGNSTFPGLHPDIIQLTEGVTFLGTSVWGTDSYISSYVADIIWKVKQLQSSILELNDPQVELHLLRSCLGIGKVNHILRTVQPDLIAKELDDFDNHLTELRSILSDILHGTVSENAWTQASLPFRLGGLGLRSASR